MGKWSQTLEFWVVSGFPWVFLVLFKIRGNNQNILVVGSVWASLQ